MKLTVYVINAPARINWRPSPYHNLDPIRCCYEIPQPARSITADCFMIAQLFHVIIDQIDVDTDCIIRFN